jgi:hypothetical protein
MQILILILLLALGGHSASASNFAGVLKSSTDDYPDSLGPPTQTLVPYLSLELSDKYKLMPSVRFQWKLYGLTNTSSKYPPENFYGDVQEAFFEFREGPSKTRIGWNTVNWGVVDVSSPNDVVNPLALFDPLRTFKQGSPMVEEILGGEALNIDMIYIPVQRPPQLPSQDSRWLPRDLLINIPPLPGGGPIYLPPNIQYTYSPSETESHALNNNAGAKLASHLGNWDIQVTHFDGVSHTPQIRVTDLQTLGTQILSPIPLTPIYYRVRTTGMGIVWAREKWIFRAETSYQDTVTEDPYLQRWSWSNVIGAETNLDMGSSTVTLIAQAYYQKNPLAADNFISSSYRIFDHTGLLGARWAYSEDLTINISGLFETQSDGLFAQAGFDQKLTEHLRWGLSWRNFSAASDSLLKTYSTNSHGTLDMTYFF